LLDLSTIVEGATDLQALPGTVTRLTSILAQEEWHMDDIVHAIQHDLSLTGRLLNLANSSISGAAVQVDTVAHAVMRLGTGPVLSLAVGAAVRRSLSGPLTGLEEDTGKLWRHSVAAALAVTEIGKHCSVRPPQESFVSALLHDVGYLALDRWLVTLPEGDERAEARASIRETDHGVLAGLISARWHLSESIQEAVVHHHAPAQAPTERGRLVAGLVNVADCAARTIGEGFLLEVNRLDRGTAIALKLTRAGFEGMCDAVERKLEGFLELYS